MRVALCSDSALPRLDGLAVTVERYRRGLQELGHEVFVCAPTSPYGRTLLHAADNYPVFAPSHRKLGQALRGADVVHVFDAGGLGLGARRLALRHGIPLVVSYLTDLLHYWVNHRAVRVGAALAGLPVASRYFGVRRGRYVRPEQAIAAVCDGAKAVLVPTAQVAERLTCIVDAEVRVLPLTSELVTGHSAPTLKSSDAATETFLYLGRLSREKSVDWLIRMFAAHIAPRRSSAKIVIGGDGHMASALKRLAQDSGVSDRVEWLGPVPRQDVLTTMAAASAFLYPSLSDTQAIVLAEAAFVGTPLVIRDPKLTWLHEYGFLAQRAVDDVEFADAAIHAATDIAFRRESLVQNQAACGILNEAASAAQLEMIYDSL